MPLIEVSPEFLEPVAVERAIKRGFCLSAIICRCFIDQATEEERSYELNEQLLPWLRVVGASAELEAWEAAALARPLGKLEARPRVDGSWMSEGLGVLGWALSQYDLPGHDTCVVPQDVMSSLKFLHPDAGELYDLLDLRPREELLGYASRAFAIHWRLREFSLNPVAIDFRHFARHGWFGPVRIDGIELVDGDLGICRSPLSKASEESVNQAWSIAGERHRAANWLLGLGEEYSEIHVNP